MPNSFKSRLKRLPLSGKLILVGAFFASISVFLPWYKDIDQFNTGDLFFGITGPMYLAGIIVLSTSVASLGLVFLKVLNKPTPKLPLSENHFHIFGSSVSFLMLVLTLSVYFHPKFGVNLTDKDAGIGIMMAFVAAGLIMLGAIVAMKRKDEGFAMDEQVDHLINIESEDRVQSDLGHNEPENKHIYDHGTMAVKNAVQDSIEEFTSGVQDQIQNTNDVQIND